MNPKNCPHDYPVYGMAPHECFWRKGPEFIPGQSTLVPFTEEDCFWPDIADGKTWEDWDYPDACGVFFCPVCQREEHARLWAELVARIGPPPPFTRLEHCCGDVIKGAARKHAEAT